MIRYAAIAVLLIALFAIPATYASYSITHIDTVVTLNTNTSASVKETFVVVLTNTSVSQYGSSREALNLTLSNWQAVIGPELVQHIINPKSGVYDFKLFPGPITTNIYGQDQTQLVITYNVRNATSVQEIAPRIFTYSFNRSFFNYEDEVSGQVLIQNTNLTMVLPAGSKITSLYPIPDLPTGLASGNFTNVTSVSWIYQEPLSKFTLTYTTQESLQQEVLSFFTQIYNFFGFFVYVIVVAVVLLFILYTYLKVEK